MKTVKITKTEVEFAGKPALNIQIYYFHGPKIPGYSQERKCYPVVGQLLTTIENPKPDMTDKEVLNYLRTNFVTTNWTKNKLNIGILFIAMFLPLLILNGVLTILQGENKKTIKAPEADTPATQE